MAREVAAGGERCLLLSFEESPQQIIRNMRSIAIDLEQSLASGLLTIESQRPAWWGLETHLDKITDLIDQLEPACVLVDPVSAFRGPPDEVAAMLARLIYLFKARGITAVMSAATDLEGERSVDVLISSLVDTWINVTNFEHDGERNRAINILKSRGMSHSNQMRELLISDNGINIADVYAGPGGVLMGTARRSQELEDQFTARDRADQAELAAYRTDQRLAALDAQIAALKAERAAEEAESRRIAAVAVTRGEFRASSVDALLRSRGAAVDDKGVTDGA